MAKGLEVIFMRARSARKRGDLAEAEQAYSEVLARYPNNIRAREGLEELSRWPQGKVPDARAMEQVNLGFRHLQIGDPRRAIAAFEQALVLEPKLPEAHVGMGVAAKAEGRIGAAIASYESALRSRPRFPEALYNLGLAQVAIGQVAEAAANFQSAIAAKPDLAPAYNSLGVAYMSIGRSDDAVACYEQAIALVPKFSEALTNMGSVMQSRGRPLEAIAWFERALLITPSDELARSQKLMQQAHICDWDGLAAEADRIPDLGLMTGAASTFSLLALEDEPARHRIRADRFAAREFALSATKPAFGTPMGRRLKIGYFSSEFHNHATMFLIARMLELHDRDRFEVHLFSYGLPKQDEMRTRAERAADSFHDVHDLTDDAIAELARRQGIQVAIDLKGYTQNNRLGIFAKRPAPVQISYLGYPGTLGANFIDYIVADRVVIPETERAHYSEQIIWLPGCYQVNDNTRHIPDMMLTRADAGLPDNGFVFCSFNNSYKITQDVFEIWVRLLNQTPDSVLWLLKANDQAVAKLREEAAARGIDPQRLVFAPRTSPAEHLARHSLADLFLDTFIVNAHTTASDALWAGLPVLTKAGRGFAARVASSLLEAVGLPDLVTTSAEEYEQRALELAKDPAKLAQLRHRLTAETEGLPLFDSELFTRNFESGLELAYRSYAAGESPADIGI